MTDREVLSAMMHEQVVVTTPGGETHTGRLRALISGPFLVLEEGYPCDHCGEYRHTYLPQSLPVKLAPLPPPYFPGPLDPYLHSVWGSTLASQLRVTPDFTNFGTPKDHS